MNLKKDSFLYLVILIPLAILMLVAAAKLAPKDLDNQKPSIAPKAESLSPSSQQPVVVTPASSENIEVLSPLTGDTVSNSFTVKGNARVFESVVSIRLTDSQGNIIVQTTTIANAPDVGKFGPFEKVITFVSEDTLGTLEVYQASPKDGSDTDKVTIPLLFR